MSEVIMTASRRSKSTSELARLRQGCRAALDLAMIAETEEWIRLTMLGSESSACLDKIRETIAALEDALGEPEESA